MHSKLANSKTTDDGVLCPASPHTRVVSTAAAAAAAAIACHLWRLVAWWRIMMWHTCKQKRSSKQCPQEQSSWSLRIVATQQQRCISAHHCSLHDEGV
jgi:hypothetical protein